jgi:hypothetical protein
MRSDDCSADARTSTPLINRNFLHRSFILIVIWLAIVGLLLLSVLIADALQVHNRKIMTGGFGLLFFIFILPIIIWGVLGLFHNLIHSALCCRVPR